MDRYKILKVEGLSIRITASVIYNLFNQYGYVELIKICHQEDGISAFVQYCFHDDALIAKGFLHGLFVFGVHLKIMLTKYVNAEEIDYFEVSNNVPLF